VIFLTNHEKSDAGLSLMGPADRTSLTRGGRARSAAATEPSEIGAPDLGHEPNIAAAHPTPTAHALSNCRERNQC